MYEVDEFYVFDKGVLIEYSRNTCYITNQLEID